MIISSLNVAGEVALGALTLAGASWGSFMLAGGALAVVVVGAVIAGMRVRVRRRGGGRAAGAPASPRRASEARILLLKLEGDPSGAICARIEATLIRRLSDGASFAAGGVSPVKAGRGHDEEARRALALAHKSRAGLVVWGAVEGGVARLKVYATGGAPEAFSFPDSFAPPFDAALAAVAGAVVLEDPAFSGLASSLSAASEELAQAARDVRPAGDPDAARLRAALARAALALDAQGGDDGALDAALSATAERDPREDSEPLEWAEAQALRAAALARELASHAEPPLADLDACAEAWRAAFEVWTTLGVTTRAARAEPARLGALLEAADRNGDRRGLEEVERLAVEALENTRPQPDGRDAGALAAMLGSARLRLGEREPRTVRLEAAERDLRRALVLAEKAGDASRVAALKDELARALARLGERDRGTERLRAAAVIFRLSLENGARGELERAKSRAGLGRTLVHVGERDRDPGAVDEAVRALRTAANGFASCGAPSAAAQARRALERAERLYAELRAARASAAADVQS